MGKTILSNTIAKIGTPISEENDKRRKTAFRDIAACLERCYREFIKYHRMKESESGQHIDEAFKNEEKMVNLINELKGEINEELLRVACFSTIVEKGGLTDTIQKEISEIISKYTSEDLAKKNVVKDFEEMNQTMVTKKLDHIRRYPSIDGEKERADIVPLVQPPRRTARPREDGLKDWQRKVMNGEDDGFFREADEGKILDLEAFRQRKNGEER